MRNMKGRIAILVIWAFILNGCTSWRTLATTDLQEEKKEDVRLYLADGTRVEIENAYVEGDSLFGTTDRSGWDAPASYAMADVLEIEEKQFDSLETSTLVIGITGLLGLLVAGTIALTAAMSEAYATALGTILGAGY